jgi:hypothetical protein
MPEYSVNFSTCPGGFSVPATLPTSVQGDYVDHYYDISGGKGGKGQGLITQGYDVAGSFSRDTKQWTGSTAYLNEIKTTTVTGRLLNQLNSGGTEQSLNINNIDAQTTQDIQLNNRLKDEYCFYRSRYSAYLTAFLDAIKPGTSASSDRQQALLNILIDLNAKINAFSTLLDEYTKTRASIVNARNDALNRLNASIKTTSAPVKEMSDRLEEGNAVLNTRKEMIRYTKEKNNSVTNQISLWAALNIVAIGMIFHLYRTL